jgi:hypothetical protein
LAKFFHTPFIKSGLVRRAKLPDLLQKENASITADLAAEFGLPGFVTKLF